MIKIFSNFETLNAFAAEIFVEIANRAIEENGKFTVALSGGSTPKALYQLLAAREFAGKVEWTRAFFFFGDERNVSPENEESNFRMANETLFQPLQIPPENVFRWQTEVESPEASAADYARKIESFFNLNAAEFPRFDLILLGMGADGHTASLFPHTEALNETEKFAVANRVEKLGTTRLTLTFPVINNSRNAMFLIKGADKAEVLREVLKGEFEPQNLPSQAVKLNEGDLFWLVDEPAAQKLAE